MDHTVVTTGHGFPSIEVLLELLLLRTATRNRWTANRRSLHLTSTIQPIDSPKSQRSTTWTKWFFFWNDIWREKRGKTVGEQKIGKCRDQIRKKTFGLGRFGQTNEAGTSWPPVWTASFVAEIRGSNGTQPRSFFLAEHSLCWPILKGLRIKRTVSGKTFSMCRTPIRFCAGNSVPTKKIGVKVEP